MADPDLIYLHNANGEVLRMSAAEFHANPDNFIGQGLQPIAPQNVTQAIADMRAAKLQAAQQAAATAEAGSVGGQVRTAATGFGTGLYDAATAIPRAGIALGAQALGVKDTISPQLSGRQVISNLGGIASELTGNSTADAASRRIGEQQRLDAAANPTTATLSSLGGQVVGAAGLGAAGKALGGAATGLLGGGKLAGYAGTALGAGLAEGAPLNLVGAQDQAFIENRKFTGDMAWSAMGTGALLVGGLSAAGKGLGEVFGAVGNKVKGIPGVAAEAGEDASAVQKLLGTHDNNLNNVVKSVTGEEALPETAGYLRKGFQGENLAEAKAAAQGDAARALRSNINEMETATKNLSPEWREAKLSNVAKTIDKSEGAFEAQAELAQDQIGTIRERVNEMRGDKIGYGDQAALKKLDDRLALAERNMGKALESGKGENMFVTLDTLKRDLGPLAKKADLAGSAASSADRAAYGEFKDLYQGLRESLTHDAWGGAAEMQQNVNAAYEKWFAQKGIFNKQFLTETGKDGWERTFGADPSKIEPYVQGLGKSRNDLTQSIIEQHISATKDLTEALAKAGELTPEKAAELASVKKAAESFEKTLGTVQQKVGAVSQAEGVLAKAKEGSGALGGAAIGHLVGGGPLGAAAGMGLAAVTNPAKFLGQRLAIEEMAAKAQRVIGTSLDDVFAGIGKAGSAAKTTAKAVSRAPIPTALELFQGKHATPEIAYQKRMDEVLAANANYGSKIRENASHVFGNLADTDPHSVGAAVVSATKAVQVLQAALPAGQFNPHSLTPNASKQPPSRLEIMQFADIYQAVMKPLDTIRQLSRGTVTRDQLDAIEQVNPRLVEHVRQQTIDRISTLDAKGIEIPYRQRQILDSLLDLGGAGDPTLTDTFAMSYGDALTDSAAQAKEDAGRPPPKAGPALGQRMLTQTDHLLGGPET